MKLVCSEKERLKKLWGFGDGQNLQASSTIEELIPALVQTSNDSDQENVIKCKICSEKFLDDQALGTHWMDSHKKEAQWLFRGYVCAICLDSFTNRSHFGNPDELWLHVLSIHPSSLRLSSAAQQLDGSSQQKVEPDKSASIEHTKSESQSVNRRYICRFCGLKFDLLPDLGRHHQAAHMGQNSTGPRLTKKGIQFYAHKLKSVDIMVQSAVPEADSLGRLADSQCSAIAKILMSEIKKPKPRPSNSEILFIASSACCKASLQASLEVKYGTLPERVYLKAAKLQSSVPSHAMNSEWTMDECHCVIDSRHFSMDLSEKNIILCDDISFGQESVPIACVVDENLLNAEGSDGQMIEYSFPWESFTYITKPLLDQSLVLESEGWAVRARETILRGTFVCEYIGEVIDEKEAMRDAIGQVPYVIATNYGNVSRYINHSCSPNLVNHQVLVESMDSQLAHIGFYASRDVLKMDSICCNTGYRVSIAMENRLHLSVGLCTPSLLYPIGILSRESNIALRLLFSYFAIAIGDKSVSMHVGKGMGWPGPYCKAMPSHLGHGILFMVKDSNDHRNCCLLLSH
ncbi:Histone-lysine N-methyltransferase SUVR5 [Sesamum angolense]|uniref:Histone-lysine N-methyltransferase SUVR5 n=1 Tax=Sesamum angolense TaxID=2727404 RepID=A0AAE1WHB4_9LAMI|nr:Histone-lysine N-methyltransferase SUVR5 [Sesamum angolense]